MFLFSVFASADRANVTVCPSRVGGEGDVVDAGVEEGGGDAVEQR